MRVLGSLVGLLMMLPGTAAAYESDIEGQRDICVVVDSFPLSEPLLADDWRERTGRDFGDDRAVIEEEMHRWTTPILYRVNPEACEAVIRVPPLLIDPDAATIARDAIFAAALRKIEALERLEGFGAQHRGSSAADDDTEAED